VKKHRFYSALFVFLSIVSYAQNGITCNPDWFIKPSVNQGFILEHRSTIGHLVKGYPTIYEFDFGKPTLGNCIWHLENNKPELGISLSVVDFKNPAQLGYAYAIAPFADIPLNQKEKRTRVIMRLAWGVTYINKDFDIKTNHKNIAIGSKVNSYVQFKWFWQIPVTKNFRFEPGFAFTHASNARAKVPNLGLNVVSANAGFHFLIPSCKKTVIEKMDSSTKVRKHNEILTYASFGYNQREVATPLLYNFHYTIAWQYNVRNTHKFGIGADMFVDQNYLIDYKQELKTEAKGFDNTRVALKFCYSYNLGRISFPFETGVYVFQKVKPDGPVVSRIGVRYYSQCGLVASVGLRTHFAVAYDFEYGLGYRFYIK